MDENEFIQIGDYIGELWPGFALNPSQAEIWMANLRPYSVDMAKRAIANAYATETWKHPSLAAVLEALRAIRRLEPTGATREMPIEEALRLMELDRQTKMLAAIKHGYSIAPAGTIHAKDLAKGKKK